MEILKTLDNFTEFINQFFWVRTFKFVLGLYLIIMAVTMFLIILRMIKRYAYLNTLLVGQETKNIKPGAFQTRWDGIVKLMETKNSDNWKAAILESSIMLNEVLEIIGYEGETLGQKLLNITPSQLENVDLVKKANEVKNEIVQNDGYKLNEEEAQKLVETFGEALRFFEAVS